MLYIQICTSGTDEKPQIKGGLEGKNFKTLINKPEQAIKQEQN